MKTVSNPIDVLVINLDKRADRLAAVTRNLAALGLGFHRISAVNGRTASAADLACSHSDGPIGALPDTTRACTASHVKAWQQIVASGAAFTLVLEDDVALHPDIASLLTDDAWIPAGVDLIKLEKFAADRPSKILAGRVLAHTPSGLGVIRRMYSRHTGSAAYILSRKGAEIALSRVGTFDVPVDHLLFNETVSSLCSLLAPAIVVPPLVWQDIATGAASDIAPLRKPAPSAHQAPRRGKRAQSLRRAKLDLSLLPIQLFRLLTGQARIVTLRTPHSKGRALPAILRKIVP